MSNTIYNVKFIDDNYITTQYRSAFLTEWSSLTDQEQGRFIELASTRIKRIITRPFIDLGDFELEQAEGVKKATARMVDYWLEYGLDLNRISGSVSLGSFSASQTAPADPDYIPENVYEVLADVNLYTQVSYINTDDIIHVDDEDDITYGVRFNTLERVKDIEINKTEAQKDLSHGNKDMKIDTSSKVDQKIKEAKLSPFVFIGTKTITTKLPTGAEIQSDFIDGDGITLDDGTVIVPSNPAAGQIVPVKGEAIRYITPTTGRQETADFDGTQWRIDNTKDALEEQVNENSIDLTEIKGNTQKRAIRADEGDIRYVRVINDKDITGKGTNLTLEGNKIPTREEVRSNVDNVKSLTNTNKTDLTNYKPKVDKNILDINKNTNDITALKTTTGQNTTDISTVKTRVDNVEPQVSSLNQTQMIQNTRLTDLENDLTLLEQVSTRIIPFQSNGIIDLSLLVDDSGKRLEILNDDKMEIGVRHSARDRGSLGKLIVNNTTGHTYVIPDGNTSDSIKLTVDDTGRATGLITNGSDTIDKYEIWRIVKIVRDVSTVGVPTTGDLTTLEARVIKNENFLANDATKISGNTTNITKNTADVLKNTTDLSTNTTGISTNKTDILQNKSDISLKQNKIDNSLITSSKDIVGAINEVRVSHGNRIYNLEEKVIDGGILLQDIKQDGDGSGQTLKEALGIGGKSINIGELSGESGQSDGSVAIGKWTGTTDQGENSVAIGYSAGYKNQGKNSIAIGNNASHQNQGENSVSIGWLSNTPNYDTIQIKAGTTVIDADSIGMIINGKKVISNSKNDPNTIKIIEGTTVIDADSTGMKINYKKVLTTDDLTVSKVLTTDNLTVNKVLTTDDISHEWIFYSKTFSNRSSGRDATWNIGVSGWTFDRILMTQPYVVDSNKNLHSINDNGSLGPRWAFSDEGDTAVGWYVVSANSSQVKTHTNNWDELRAGGTITVQYKKQIKVIK